MLSIQWRALLLLDETSLYTKDSRQNTLLFLLDKTFLDNTLYFLNQTVLQIIPTPFSEQNIILQTDFSTFGAYTLNSHCWSQHYKFVKAIFSVLMLDVFKSPKYFYDSWFLPSFYRLSPGEWDQSTWSYQMSGVWLQDHVQETHQKMYPSMHA